MRRTWLVPVLLLMSCGDDGGREDGYLNHVEEVLRRIEPRASDVEVENAAPVLALACTEDPFSQGEQAWTDIEEIIESGQTLLAALEELCPERVDQVRVALG